MKTIRRTDIQTIQERAFRLSGFTPEPWKLDKDWMLIKGPKGEEICAIHSGQTLNCGNRADRSIAHSNAKLIEAAPDLLKQRDALLKTCKLVLSDLADAIEHDVIKRDDFIGTEGALLTAIELCKESHD